MKIRAAFALALASCAPAPAPAASLAGCAECAPADPAGCEGVPPCAGGLWACPKGSGAHPPPPCSVPTDQGTHQGDCDGDGVESVYYCCSID